MKNRKKYKYIFINMILVMLFFTNLRVLAFDINDNKWKPDSTTESIGRNKIG